MGDRSKGEEDKCKKRLEKKIEAEAVGMVGWIVGV